MAEKIFNTQCEGHEQAAGHIMHERRHPTRNNTEKSYQNLARNSWRRQEDRRNIHTKRAQRISMAPFAHQILLFILLKLRLQRLELRPQLVERIQTRLPTLLILQPQGIHLLFQSGDASARVGCKNEGGRVSQREISIGTKSEVRTCTR